MINKRSKGYVPYLYIYIKYQSLIFWKKLLEKQNFTLNICPKKKQKRLIQTKKNKINEESYLNFKTIAKYAFCLLTFYFSSDKLNKLT